jgi:hypothetical protein
MSPCRFDSPSTCDEKFLPARQSMNIPGWVAEYDIYMDASALFPPPA